MHEDVRHVFARKPTSNLSDRLLERPQGQERPAYPTDTAGIGVHNVRGRRSNNSRRSGGDGSFGRGNGLAEVPCRPQAPGEREEACRPAQS